MRIERQQDVPMGSFPPRRLLSPELKHRSERYFTIRQDGGAITCHLCGFTSTNPHDIKQKFCPRCLVFHEDRTLMIRLNEGYQTEFYLLNQEPSHFKSAA